MDELNNKEIEQKVSETVEQMKAKIDEISNEAQKVDGPNASKAKELSEKATDILKQASDKLMDVWKNITDPEEVKKALDFVSTKSKEVYDTSMKKIKEFVESDETKKVVNEAEQFIKDAGDKASEVLKGAYDKAMENPDVKKIADGVSKTYNDAVKAVDNFLEKPEVQQGIEKAKDVTIDYAEKAVAALKEWLKPEKKDDDNK